MVLYTTRNVVELKVGAHRSTQLQLHLRTCDIKWFNENRDRNMEQILSLVSSEIMPQICNEQFQWQNNKGKTVDKKGPVKTADTENMKKKRKVESPSKTKSLTYIPMLETKYLFGESIQITYRITPAQSGQRAVLTMKSEEGDSQLPSFEYLRPLSKNIIMWCYPFDPLSPKRPAMDKTDGFPRTEFIPLSSLFKESNY